MNSTCIFKTLSLLLLFLCLGCNNFVEVAPSKTRLATSEAFKSDESATAAVTGIYAMMKSLGGAIGNGTMTFYPGMSADELVKFGVSAETSQFANNQLLSTNSNIANIWISNYKIIGQANSCIEGISQSTFLSPAVKSQLLGEAKISRALLYFYLVNLYGDVPLVLTTDWTQTQSISRSTAAQVYTTILNDLKDTGNEMSEDYPTSDKVRPNTFAALALLARVYLYTGDWKNAEATASQVIESGRYNPLPDISGAFLATNTEAIWQLQPTAGLGYDTEEARVIVPYNASNPPGYYLTDALLNSFEPGDLRRIHWIDSITYNDKTYYYPYKYKIIDASNGLNEYYTILRLSETYLIRAEARAQNGYISGAIDDLNIIRERARDVPTSDIPDPLPALSSSLTKEQVLVAVEKERRTELFAEWGHRWFDLKRTGRCDVVLQPGKPFWTPAAKLYPIPQTERKLNAHLSQNEGYN